MAERIHIDTAAKRARLPHRRNRYWQGVSGGRGGVSLGYRKARFGPGSWIGKIVISGARIEERLAPADDGAALAGALDYAKAVSSVLEWARQKYAAIEERADVANQGSEPTIQSAVVAYISRRKRQSKHGTDASSRLTKHVIENERFAAKRLNKITADGIARWREELPRSLAPATVNRLLNDLRAALHGAVEKHRRALPAHIAGEIRVGTRPLPSATEARRQILSDADVRRVIDAAFSIDPDGDFGRLILLLGATGARFSQVAALTVADVQPEQLRVMVPAAKKGRGAKIGQSDSCSNRT